MPPTRRTRNSRGPVVGIRAIHRGHRGVGRLSRILPVSSNGTYGTVPPPSDWRGFVAAPAYGCRVTRGQRAEHAPGGPGLVAHLLSDDPMVDRVLDVVRDLTEEERDALVAAGRVVDELTTGNPFFALERTYARWLTTYHDCWDLIDDVGEMQAERAIRHDLPSAVNAVLFEFRAFVDQIDHWAHETLDAEGRAAVVAQTQTEYGGSFPYRLACNLRNTAQHRASVVAVTSRNREVAPGQIESDLAVSVARDVVDNKWQPRVRREFAEANHPISVHELLRDLMQSCERIVARLLITAEQHAHPAISRILAATAEVRRMTEDDGAVASVMIDEMKARPDGSMYGDMRLTHLRHDHATSLDNMIA